MDIIKSIEHEQLKNKVPNLKVGDTVRVHQRIKEGNRERIQVFEGIIIKIQGGGVNTTFTVRRISYGVGVEKTFLLHSPLVEKVQVVRVGKARRAKLYYLRDRVGKAAKTKEHVGAKIQTTYIDIKEDLVEAPVEEEVVPGENEVVEEVTVMEAPVEEVKVAEEPVKEEVKEEAEAEKTVEEPVKDEEVKEEKPAKEEEIKEEDSAPVEEAKTEEVANPEVKEEVKTEEVKAEKEETKKEEE